MTGEYFLDFFFSFCSRFSLKKYSTDDVLTKTINAPAYVHLNFRIVLMIMHSCNCTLEALKIRQLRLPDSEKVAVTHEKIGSLARAIGKSKKAQIAFEGNVCQVSSLFFRVDLVI